MLETPNRPDHSVTGGEKRSESRKTTFEDISNNQYEKLLQEYESKYKNLKEGQIIKGRVLKITEGEVFVDVGHKSEGIVPIREVLGPDGQVNVKPGDEVSVLLEQNEDVDGYLLLSREKAERIRVWDLIESAYRENRVVTGRVVEKVKGGLSVDIGFRAFLPG